MNEQENDTIMTAQPTEPADSTEAALVEWGLDEIAHRDPVGLALLMAQYGLILEVA